MKYKFALIPFLFITFFINGQDRLRSAYKDYLRKVERIYETQNEQILGSHYFNEEFIKGKINIEDKQLEDEFDLRYNAYKDEIEVLIDGEITILMKDPRVNCLIGNYTYTFQLFNDKKQNLITSRYLKNIYTGTKHALYIKESKKYKEAKKAKTSLTPDQPARLVDYEELYVLNSGDNIAQPLPKKKKLILKYFPAEKQKMMDDFFKQNKINPKNTEDVVSLFKYYNENN